MKKYKRYKIFNAVFCVALVAIIMIAAYESWSMHSKYTIGSFLASLLMHGGFGLMIYLGIDNFLKRIFDCNE